MAVKGYIRVSTDRQDVENQRHEILEFANSLHFGPVVFVEETVSGRTSWKDRQIAALIEGLEDKDLLFISELSRLGRSMLEIMEILSIATRRGIHVYAAKGSWVLDGGIQSKIMAMVFSMASEIERDLISQRTRAALAARRAMGVKLGRPRGPGRSKLDPHRDEIKRLLDLGVTKRAIARRMQTSERNLGRYLKRRRITASPC